MNILKFSISTYNPQSSNELVSWQASKFNLYGEIQVIFS